MQRKPLEGSKFITVGIELFADGDKPRKVIEGIAQGSLEILNNTQICVDENDQYQGCINSKLGINTILTYATKGNDGIRNISKVFYAHIKKDSEGWKINLFPSEENDGSKWDYYAVPRLNQDLPGIIWACEQIMEGLKVERIGKTFNRMSFLKKEPEIELIAEIFHMKYLVKDRLDNLVKYPDNLLPDQKLFKESIFTTFIQMKKQSEMRNLADFEKEWIEKVDKLLRKYNPEYDKSAGELIVNRIGDYFKSLTK